MCRSFLQKISHEILNFQKSLLYAKKFREFQLESSSRELPSEKVTDLSGFES